MRLHLGCGQRYLDGYVNIDFPPAEHTVQSGSVADLHADLLQLRYPPGSIREVRLHHVFEHFPRPVACALLASWHAWLQPGGVLRIEVPDLARTARVVLNPFAAQRAKSVAIRHLYGSHEARWAVHCEGYTPGTLKHMVGLFGFMPVNVVKSSWQGTCNFELTARRSDGCCDFAHYCACARQYLEAFRVDQSPSETTLLKVWMDAFARQARAGGIADG
jgi:hypothetical protein